MIKRKKFRKVLMMVMLVLLTITINSATVLAKLQLDYQINEDFLIDIRNPYGEEKSIIFSIVYYDKNDKQLHAQKCEEIFQPHETKTIDAKEYFDSKETKKLQLKVLQQHLTTRRI